MLSDISLCISLLFCKMRCLLISKPCHAQCSEQEGRLPLCFINMSYFFFPSGLGGFCWKLLDYKHIILTVIDMLISYLCWLSLSEYFYQPLLPLPYVIHISHFWFIVVLFKIVVTSQICSCCEVQKYSRFTYYPQIMLICYQYIFFLRMMWLD
jgi:hypothetical protein